MTEMNCLLNKPILARHVKPMKETSIDDNDGVDHQYMTNSKTLVIDFDDVKDDYVREINYTASEKPCSNDALFQNGKGENVFVEFKNGYINKKTAYMLVQKLYDSILIYSDIMDVKIKDIRDTVVYILVYNEDKNKCPSSFEENENRARESSSLTEFSKMLANKSKKEYIRFGLQKYEHYLVREVHTYTENEYNRYLMNEHIVDLNTE